MISLDPQRPLLPIHETHTESDVIPSVSLSMSRPDQSKIALPQLVLKGYRPTTFDYMHGTIEKSVWLEVFRSSLPAFKRHAMTDTSVPQDKRASAVATFEKLYLDTLIKSEASDEEVNCLSLCRVRDECLRLAGFGDIFLSCKVDENEQALALLPSLLTQLDSMGSQSERWEMALRGIFAGNLFDLGAAASASAFEAGQAGAAAFQSTRDSLLPRPWVIDNMDDMLINLPDYDSVVMFVDNAGSDVILGMIPLARELLRSKASVILAANEGYTLNDITSLELKDLVGRIAEIDSLIKESVEAGRLTVISSGSSDPVIDLSNISRELADLTLKSKVDLIILEGMGRGIETNLFASFTCDSFKLGMVKHPEVAECLGGRLYDCVCKLDKKV